ncbi:hypothetical protein M441DRAFT_64850 [Trichoderma asperellum CBS 433.97]|uniref:Extracellular membrane protein CFEM domain-containing protein n=1 Tax=Trichoderma asperellum (strain ATCC 204424 / CBS 433.97 / NBRC 101777) TaxID=1042311 RepID=A0A2T3ZK39_TRIA4|nr:hypothetical protein M441DRAFT_64850 [Trichoderma asperellum CBS 433.97]PTB45174.1 hypothetical protein M441DRAFT_64850 [Trichoderma asperellum CBS 433.97]
MRASSVAVVSAACLSVGIAAADDGAPQCAVDCASSIRNANGSLDLKVICADKLMTNSLFQCLISSCPQDTYAPAVAHVVLACSDLGLSIGPLHPVEVQHVNLEKPPYLITPSLPATYDTPSDASQQNTEHVTLSFDISLDLKCNSGPDGLVTVSLPPSSPSPPAPSPPAPSPPSVPPSPPTPDPEIGEGESENGSDNGSNGNGGGNGNGKPTVSSSPAEETLTTPDPADPSATTSCPPDSAPSNVQGPGDEQAPPQSTELGQHGGPAETSAPSPMPPNGHDPVSLPSETPCSTASDTTGGLDPEDTEDPSRIGSSPSPTQEASDPPDEGDKPEVSVTSNVEGMPSPAPVPAPPTPAPASSPFSTTNGAAISVDPIPGSQIPQTAEPTPDAQASPLPSSSSSPASTSLTVPEPLTTIHPMPLPLPMPSPPSYQSADNSGDIPLEYAPSGLSEQAPDGESSDSELSPPEPNAGPLPQETHGTKVDATSSYGHDSQEPSAPVPVPASQTDSLAAQTADGKPTGKTTEPSEVTLWPTATSNKTSCTTGSARGGGSPTTSCKSDGKQTTDALVAGDTQQNEPLGSIMVKIIRSDDSSAETMLTALWENVPPATTLSRGIVESMQSKEVDHASATQFVIGSSPTATSTADTGHHHVGSSNVLSHTGFATPNSKPIASSIQPNSTAMAPSPPRVALTSSDSKPTPYLYMMTLLAMLTSWALMS